mmetsp:Transcript_93135/g.287401  ORF Transcript_93135/g.287401 Transcript_93135/m.287401 type:complete len:139 (-) Transcript_93135:559-975(-)
MAAVSCTSPRARGRAALRALLVGAAAAAVLCLAGGRPAVFAAPSRGGSALAGAPAGQAAAPARPAVAALSSEEYGSGTAIVDQVEALRRESLEACLLAHEDDPDAVERCSALSYELAQAEQLLFKRQAAFRYVDHDSY